MTQPEQERDAADYYVGRPTHDTAPRWIGSTDEAGDLATMFLAGLFEPRDILTGATETDYVDCVERVLVDLASGLYHSDEEPSTFPTVSLPPEAYDRLVGHGDEGYRAGWPWGPHTSQDTAWAYCYASASVYVYRRGILYATVHLNRAHGGYGTPAPFPIMGER